MRVAVAECRKKWHKLAQKMHLFDSSRLEKGPQVQENFTIIFVAFSCFISVANFSSNETASRVNSPLDFFTFFCLGFNSCGGDVSVFGIFH